MADAYIENELARAQLKTELSKKELLDNLNLLAKFAIKLAAGYLADDEEDD